MSDERQPANGSITAADLVRTEARALEALAQRLDTTSHTAFGTVVDALCAAVQADRRAVLTGIACACLALVVLAFTMISLGVPAAFLHPAEALHGDLGLLRAGDVLLALSYSGETEELLRLLPVLPRLNIQLVAFTGCTTSSLARAASHVLDVSVEREACLHQLAPTASTTAMLALGDALAVCISDRLAFAPQDFADLHPGGHLGRKLTTVAQLMHSGDALPSVAPATPMPDLIHEMSAKRLGMTTVQHNGTLVGVLSDGDLRRLFEHDGANAFTHTAADVMNPSPHTISPSTFATDAFVLMERHKITALVVTTDGTPQTPAIGVVHLHDLWDVSSTSTR